MSKGSKSQIKLGAILSYLNIAIGNIIPLAYTPMMLSILGKSEYGLYKIASSTTSYLSLMTLGIGSAVTRYLIKAKTDGGKKAEEGAFGLFHLIFQLIALFTCIVGAIVVFNLDSIYDASLTAQELHKMQILVALMVLNMAVGFSATAYSASVITHERFIFVQCINILTTIGTPVLNVVFLFLGYGSVGMVSVSLGINVIARIAYLWYVKKSLQLKPRYNNMPKSYLGEILKFSFWIFVGTLAGQLYNATDTVIIGAIPALATSGAAVYNIGITFPNIMLSLSQVVPILFMPKANKMVFSGAKNSELTDMVIQAGRLQGFIIALFCSGFIAFGRPFIHWYAGAEYQDAYWVAALILIPNCIPLVQSVAHSIMQAKNMHRFRAILYLIIAIVNVIATLLLVDRFGIIGAAIPTGIAFFIGHGLILNLYYWKKVGINIPRFWLKLLPIFFTATAPCLVTLFLSRFIDFYNHTYFIIGVIAFIAVYVILLWLFVLDKNEKNMIISPVYKIFKKICKKEI